MLSLELTSYQQRWANNNIFILYLYWKQLRWFQSNFQNVYNIDKIELFLISIWQKKSFIVVRVKINHDI